MSPKQVVGFTCVFNSEIVQLIRKFIVQNNIDKRASDAFRIEDAETQTKVMEMGSMNDCRNCSSALMARIKAAKRNRGCH